MSGNITIIRGKHKNKKLINPPAEVTRAAQSVIREILYNWLRDYNFEAKRCLDLFAGTGILSWEALSSGAAYSLMIDQNQSVCRMLRQQAAVLGFGENQAGILRRDVVAWLSKKVKQSQQVQPFTDEANTARRTSWSTSEEEDKFDLIFIDPPYSRKYLDSCLSMIMSINIINPNGYIFYEVNKRQYEEIPYLQEESQLSSKFGEQYRLIKQSKRGNTYFGLINLAG